ncbi:MAG: hypothetical protein F4X82_02030 [Candidatus Spechtbacteria bacterium SB0662_bin_43]|uniref:Uncharacterized protein n=1 Tax=Candidatus Spechtbacteria bacterium SB0662_bin_43 TaxID=2604897 RepID=A0A845DJA9_9BACT|nr:hypothetical protein [Candidatus Spechtbacteria bacterium SB0662_bin_43]
MSNAPQNDIAKQLRLGMEPMTFIEALEVLVTRMKILEQKEIEPDNLPADLRPEEFVNLLMLPTEDNPEAILREFVTAICVLIERTDEVKDMVEIFERYLTRQIFT